MEKRVLGRLGHESSVLIYGAAGLGEVTQDVADESVRAARAAGVNHFDVAPSYGEAELRLGPLMGEIRDDIFLATKTGQRSYEAAWKEINESLERLRTDRLDLLQLHAVCDLRDLDGRTADDGPLAAAIRAKDEGMTKAVGITGHTHAAPVVHREALRRYDFDTVLTPLNYALWQVPGFADAYTELAEAAQASGAGLMTIKAFARRPWPSDDERYATWYEPLDEQRWMTAACAWVLNGHPEVTGIATSGETTLLAKMVEAERARAGMSVEEAEAILREVEGYRSPFEDPAPTGA